MAASQNGIRAKFYYIDFFKFSFSLDKSCWAVPFENGANGTSQNLFSYEIFEAINYLIVK